MKLLLLVFIFFGFSVNTFSQSIALLNAELEKTVVPGAEVKTDLHIKNNSDKFIKLAIRQVNRESVSNLSFALCYKGTCWEDPALLEAIELAPGQTLEGLTMKFQAGFDLSVQDVALSFYNTDNPAEQLSQNFKFSIRDNFSNGTLFSSEEIQVSNAYPNPVSTHATIDYDVLRADTQAKVVIHNILGNKVMDMPLEKGEMNLKVLTDALENGIYFYSLHVNGKRVATKKMVVKK